MPSHNLPVMVDVSPEYPFHRQRRVHPSLDQRQLSDSSPFPVDFSFGYSNIDSFSKHRDCSDDGNIERWQNCQCDSNRSNISYSCNNCSSSSCSIGDMCNKCRDSMGIRSYGIDNLDDVKANNDLGICNCDVTARNSTTTTRYDDVSNSDAGFHNNDMIAHTSNVIRNQNDDVAYNHYIEPYPNDIKLGNCDVKRSVSDVAIGTRDVTLHYSGVRLFRDNFKLNPGEIRLNTSDVIMYKDDVMVSYGDVIHQTRHKNATGERGMVRKMGRCSFDTSSGILFAKFQSLRRQREEIRRRLAADGGQDQSQGGDQTALSASLAQGTGSGGVDSTSSASLTRLGRDLNRRPFGWRHSLWTLSGASRRRKNDRDGTELNDDKISENNICSKRQSILPSRDVTSPGETQCLLPTQNSTCDWLADDDEIDEESSDDDVIDDEREKCDVTKDNEDDIDDVDGGEKSELLVKQSRLKLEAKMALAQVESMARMQIEVEKRGKKKSPIAEMVGLPDFGLTKKFRLTIDRLRWMAVSELQLITNDLLTQIEVLNRELVDQLIERDDLYMEQDAVLIDIDDLTRCQQEQVTRSKSMNR